MPLLAIAGLGLFGRLEGRRFVWNSIQRSSHDVSRRKYECREFCVEFLCCALAVLNPGFQAASSFVREERARNTPTPLNLPDSITG